VSGNLSVQGTIVQATSTSPLLWADSSDPSFDTGTEVCAAAGLVCLAARQPDGTALADCATVASGGIFYAMCEQP
jgi:hypothetical protein